MEAVLYIPGLMPGALFGLWPPKGLQTFPNVRGGQNPTSPQERFPEVEPLREMEMSEKFGDEAG